MWPCVHIDRLDALRGCSVMRTGLVHDRWHRCKQPGVCYILLFRASCAPFRVTAAACLASCCTRSSWDASGVALRGKGRRLNSSLMRSLGCFYVARCTCVQVMDQKRQQPDDWCGGRCLGASELDAPLHCWHAVAATRQHSCQGQLHTAADSINCSGNGLIRDLSCWAPAAKHASA